MPGRLLTLLRRQRDQWLTLEALTAALHASPTDIIGRIDALHKLGHHIEQQPHLGYRWVGVEPGLTADRISCGLQTRRIGNEVVVFDTTDSTNDVAAHYAREGKYDGLAIFAEQQRRGRGRLERSWLATKGSSLLCSIVLQQNNNQIGGYLSLLAGLAVAESVDRCCRVRSRIKWPNDVILEGRKLAGILIETCRRRIGGEGRMPTSRDAHAATAYIVGIGVNCLQSADDFPPELQTRAISLRQVAGDKVDRLELAQILLETLDDFLVRFPVDNPDALHNAWVSRCDDIGRRLTVMCDGRSFSGRVIDVNAQAGLIVQLDSGPVRLFDPAITTVSPV
ncbi:MAG: biotin--[acetyl-CoA-carboxylase] ligase [Sedimentisphaerales bacterium]|nr:biotin--[acetyl-CoA-carboxylase] ligase [Sedimentisphaerales bacterium]